MALQETLQITKLTDHVSQEIFDKIKSALQRHFKLLVETTDLEGRTIRSLCSSGCYPDFCKRVRHSKIGAERCREERIRSLNVSIETGQPYLTVCHAGVVLGCIPVMDNNQPLGGMFFGKCIWKPFDELLEADIQKRLRGLHITKQEISETLQKIPVVSAR